MIITDNGKTMTLAELALCICNSYTADDCNTACPAALYCRAGHNGMLDWLRKVLENAQN